MRRAIFPGGKNEQIFGWWGVSPYPPSRENPSDELLNYFS